MAFFKLMEDLPRNYKVALLARKLGVSVPQAVGHLVCFWTWVCSDRTDGVLAVTDEGEAEFASQWPAELAQKSTTFVSAMISVGFLDYDKECEKVYVRNWSEYCELGKRAESQRKRREARRNVTKPLQHVTKPKSASRELRVESGELRLDNKINIRKDNIVEVANSDPSPAAPVVSVVPVIESRDSSAILSVFAYYRAHRPRRFPRPSSKLKEWARIKALLSSGYSVENICAAIDGCMQSGWHQGDNDRGVKYDSLELITRNSTKLEQFMALAIDPAPVILSKSEKRLAEVYRDFAGAEDKTQKQGVLHD
jgi:hypothetical protein